MFVRYRSQRAKWVLALVGVVLCCIGVALSAAAGGFSAGATPRRSGAAGARGGAAAARTVPVNWDAYAVGPREASLELIVERGTCGSIQTNVVERRDSVLIEIDEAQRPGACLAVAAIAPLDVRLAHPLAGRAIQGPSRRRVPTIPLRSLLDLVPRLIGFAPRDASQALALVSLHGQTRIVHGARGLPRVLAQDPAPGQRTPNSRIVRITIAGG